MLIFAWNIPLVSLIFLKRSLVFPILLFSSISLHWSLRKAFLSLLVILWNSALRWVFSSFSPLLLASLLFSAICKASNNHLSISSRNLNSTYWRQNGLRFKNASPEITLPRKDFLLHQLPRNFGLIFLDCRQRKYHYLPHSTVVKCVCVCVCVCVYVLTHFSRFWLLATPWTIAHQAPLSMGF